MSEYSVQINTGIGTNQYNIHTWLQINKPNGEKEAYGFYPARDDLKNIIYGPGDVRMEPSDAIPTGTSGPITISEIQYRDLKEYIESSDITPPNYSIPLGSQCTNWALMTLAETGIIPHILGPTTGGGPLQTLIWNPIWQQIGWAYWDLINRAKNWTWPRDPLILDLDGDGLETVGLAADVHFDHDGDGVLTRTGWAGADDALLVRDIDGNGRIDTGAELFGDFTPLADGSLAANGFAALAALDANGDGMIDANDPAFDMLRLWRDANQNGLSDADELISLTDAGIHSLNVGSSLMNRNLANGNQLAREGSFTRSDGTTAALGEFRLAADTFSARFLDAIDIPESIASLPSMRGSGKVRELQQAAALSDALVDTLSLFQATSTRAEQKSLLDQLLGDWADTSTMARTLEERTGGDYRIRYEAFGNERRSSNVVGSTTGVGNIVGFLSDADDPLLSESYRTLIAEWSHKIHVLEAFGGQYFFNLPTQKSQTAGANWGLNITAGSGTSGIASLPLLRLDYSQPQLDLLQQAYDDLKENVYASLVMQTRLKPYLDQIELSIDDSGVHLDATALNQMLADRKSLDPENYLADLLDLDRYASHFLYGTNWTGLAEFDAIIDSLPPTEGIVSLLAEFNVRILGNDDGSMQLGNAADFVLAGDGNDTLYGYGGNDRLFGQDGNDRLLGGGGDDLLSGGAGNDVLIGETGADTYVFGRGNGHDIILDNVENGVRRDTVRFIGLVPADIRIGADHEDKLVFVIIETGETLSVPAQGYHWGANGVGRYVFDDGTVWSHDDALRETVASATDGDDLIHGSSTADVIIGEPGNDTLIGNGGDDVLDGGPGNDILIGSTSWLRVYDEGQYRFERDTKPLVAANGNDTYLFGHGDGRDTIFDGDRTSGNVDTLRFKDDVSPDEVRLIRDGNDLVLAIRGTTDQVTLTKYFEETHDGQNGSWLIERIVFADGTSWTYSDVRNLLFAGSDDADLIVGTSAPDVLSGRGGDDVLLGGAGHDLLDGGPGNDVLRGGAVLFSNKVIGDLHGEGDSYRFGRGDGHDLIIEDSWLAGEVDRIELKAGIGPEDIRLERVRSLDSWPVIDSLRLTIRDTGETLTVSNHFDQSNRFAIEEIVFDDGTTWDMEAIRARALLGDAGNDELLGFSDRDDLIVGGAGNDRLVGLSGDDVLVGGPGDDALEGGQGSDTYRFGLGDGNDVIIDGSNEGFDVLELGAGITTADVTVRWTRQSGMSVTLADGSSVNVLYQAERWSDRNGIEALHFDDGTSWDRSTLASRALVATSGDDLIVGSYENDTLDGGAGDDHFWNLGGYDTYLFGFGDGHDVIEATYGRISFKTGVDQNGIDFSRDGDDLIVTLTASGDALCLNDWLGGGQSIDSFTFANGASLNARDVLARLELDTGYEILYGSPGADILIGTAANSTIFGREGDDVLIGGAGNDTLYGEAGDDTLDGGADRDLLHGGAGTNTYIVAPGTALDTASGASGAIADDTVVFSSGIRPTDLSIQLGDDSSWWGSQPGDTGYTNLVIGFGGNDALIVQNDDGRDLARGAIQHFRFDDGTEWTLADVIAHADDGRMGAQDRDWDGPLTLLGSQADDWIYDFSDQSVTVQARGNDDYVYLAAGNNRVSAGSGEDTVYLGQGNDLIAGEAGDDTIEAGDGDDLIVFNYGDGYDWLSAGRGVDTLSFGSNVTPAMLAATIDRYGNTTLLIDAGAGGTITLAGYDQDGPAAGLERLQFIDDEGRARIFDLDGWLRSNAIALLNATTESPLEFDGDNFELTGSVAPAGGLEAIAYAQSGDLFAAAAIAHNSPTDGDDVLYGSNEDDVLDAGAGNDMVLGLDGSDVLFGGAGDDLLDGGDGDDTLDGGPGNDTLYGGWGADVLVGGTGHDQLFGGWGGDTYLYQAGDGVTIIDDDHLSIGWNTGGDGDNYVVMDDTPNILHFGPGIEAGRLHFAERDGDLLITFSDRPDDQLILRGHEPGRATLTRSIDLIRFDDGSEIAAQSIAVKGLTLIASEEDDWLYGSPFADTLVGSDGDDWLVGNGGADRLLGGTGSDTYLVYKDWDAAPVQTSIHETWRERDINRIELSGDIDAADLHLALDGNELLLRLNEGGDAIRFAGFDPRADGMQAPVNEIELPWEDASLSFDDLLARGIRIIGTPDDDVLEGTPLADWFEGREANDTMHGGAGGDVYLIEADGGTDTIIDSEDGGAPNILVLPEGTSLDALRLSYDDEGFLVIDLVDGGNRVRLSGFDPDDPLGARAVQRIRFGIDGDEIGYEELLARGFDIFGSEANDALRGTALDDRIFGRDGNDLIEATPGGDWLAGEGGSDTYLLQRGDGLVTIDDHATETAGNLLRFGAGIEADALHDSLRFMPDGNGGHLLAITYGADDDIVRLTGFDPQDVLGNHAIEQFEFADGDRVDYATLTSWGFVIEGDNSANALGGTNVDDRLYGYDGDDLLEAGAGNDVLTGGRGNDLLRGGAGRDAYVFNFGDGQDLIEDEVEDGVGNVLSLGEGIRREDIHIEIDGNDLLVHYGNDGDMVRVSNHTPQGAQGGTVIDTLEFADGTSVTLREFMNRAPTLTQPIAGQVARANTAFQLTLPADLFSDPDGDDVLLRTAVASHGSLAQWLQFDAATRSLYGTPQDDDVGEFDLVIEGMDSLGATTLHEVRFSVESAGQTLSIAPDFANVVEDRKLIALGNVLANDSDPNGGSLRVTDAGIRLGSHGLLTLLPNGSYVYVLNDLLPSVQGLGAGETVADHFDYHAGNASAHGASELIVTVTGTNDAPMLRHALADVQLAKGKAFAWQLPENAFQDRDRNDTLSYTATLPNGKPLPAWLGFDPATRIFSGTAPNSLTGNLDVRITASDGNGPGSNAADVFRIRLDSRTNVPAAIQPIPGADAYPGMTPTPTGPTTVQPLQQAVASLADNLLSRFLDSLGKSPSLVNPAAVVLDRLVPTPAPRPVDESVHSAQHTGEDFSRCWSDMLTALDGLDAQRQDAPAWSNPNLGADINALAGWLPGSGRSVNGGVDKVSLLAAGTQLRQFSGLREGISQLVG